MDAQESCEESDLCHKKGIRNKHKMFYDVYAFIEVSTFASRATFNFSSSLTINKVTPLAKESK